jgi:hypothetical protein
MRLQIEVTEEQDRHIQVLLEEAGLTTKKDLFNNALTLLSWAIEEVGTGNTIASVNEDQQRYRELHMPILNHVARRAKERHDKSARASKRVAEPV